MNNLHLIGEQPRWRVAIVALLAKLMGVLIHVEGIPFGSVRTRRRKDREAAATSSGSVHGLPRDA